MDNKILLEALLKNKAITPEMGERLLGEAEQFKKSVEDIIYGRRLLNEVQMAQIKSEILKIPYQNIAPDSVASDALALIPEETAKTYNLAPIKREGQMLVVGMVHPEDVRAQETLAYIAKSKGLSLGAYIITPTNLELLLRRYGPYESEIQKAVSKVSVVPGKGLPLSQRIVSMTEGAVGEEAPIIKIVATTLEEAVSEGASDIHVEPQKKRLRIRFRVDGVLREVSSLPIELHQPIISRLKILSDLKIDETRIPQDGRFRTNLLSRDIDFRVSTFPTPSGEKMAIRVLDSAVGLKGLENLGFLPSSITLIKEAIAKPYGMILITGPTGSGKTTTLYSILQILNTDEVNVLSLEDPVEYFIEGANQSQVHPEIGYDFSSGLREILRQDPDVIMVGEIRDKETAGLAVHAALTGHIVLSTLHTNNAIGVIPRLIDMGVDSYLIPSALNLMLSQRLLPKLCETCRNPKAVSPEVQQIIKTELGKIDPKIRATVKFKEPFESYEAPGCKVCKGRGMIGRVGIFEILIMTRELRSIISSDINDEKVLTEARRQGMVTMRQDGIIKALNGIVSIEEVLKETSETE